jgi:TRAP-type C4-dicarboxylate transport system permease small subunit
VRGSSGDCAVQRGLKWLEVPIHLLLWLGMLAGFLMMAHVSADVTARTLFNHPLPGTTEIVSAYYMVAVAYLPWAYIASRDGHIAVELFTRLAPARFNAWLDIAVKILTIAYVSLFSWETALRALHQFRANEVWEAAGGYIPVWPSRCLLPLAGGLMALYLVLRVAADLAKALRR